MKKKMNGKVKGVEGSKLDRSIDKKLKLKEGSKLDKAVDKQEAKVMKRGK